MPSSWNDNGRHVIMHKIPGALPHVCPVVPVLVLGRPNLELQALAVCAGVGALAHALLDEFPASVNVLGASFDFEGFTSWQLVGHNLDKGGLGPDPFATFLDALFLVHYTAMQDIREPKFVGTRRVCVEDDVLASQMLLPQWCPVMFADGTRTRCTANGEARIQASTWWSVLVYSTCK